MALSTTDNNYIALWLFASLVSVIPALSLLSASFVDGSFIPAGNDSFYHARRIIDFAVNGTGFYQFDERIHVPEGSLLTWPWAYDYLMGLWLKLGLFVYPDAQPMKLLAYVPTFFILVNMGLFIALLRASGLPQYLAIPATFAFALLPLNQSLHGVGIIDHHYLELTFVLLSSWSLLATIRKPDSPWLPILLGLSMGIASGFHTSLFIIQAPVVLALFALWLKGQAPPASAMARVAVALLASSVLVALPSLPAQELRFEYTTLSLFHVYIAFCSAAAITLMAKLPFSGKNLGILVGAGVLLALPLAIPLLVGTNYLMGGQVGLPDITEVASPFEMWATAGTHTGATRYYSFLVFVAPLMIPLAAWLAWTGDNARDTALGVLLFIALALLLTQYRMHPFGSWAMLVAPCLLALHFLKDLQLSPYLKAAGVFAVLALTFITPSKQLLFERYPPWLTTDYAVVHDMFSTLSEACEREPGVVLALSDDGHPIRYHTECSVIANNFLLTEQHGRKFSEVQSLLELEPSQLLEQRPDVDYVLVHMRVLFHRRPDGIVPTNIPDLFTSNPKLFGRLALEGVRPPGFELVREMRFEDGRDGAYVQLFRIRRDP